MNYYQHHIGDYRRDTAHLTLIEHGVYRQLLDMYYLNEMPITSDKTKLMRSLCVRNADEEKAVENVLSDFFLLNESGYVHKRCDLEIEAFHGKSQSARDSANARWQRIQAERDANALRTQSEGNANHKPLTINHKPIKGKTKTRAKALEFDAKADLVGAGVPEQIVIDWLAIRKLKKAPATKTALLMTKKQIGLAGLSLAEGLSICCQRGWAGFKAEWVGQQSGAQNGKPGKFDPTAYVNRNRSQGNERIIDVDEHGEPVR